MNLRFWKYLFFLIFFPSYCYSRYDPKLTFQRQSYQKHCLEKAFFSKLKLPEIYNKKSRLTSEFENEDEDYECDKRNVESTYFTNIPITGGVWPLPQYILYGPKNRTIKRDGITFHFHGMHDSDCDILKYAINTYCKHF